MDTNTLWTLVQLMASKQPAPSPSLSMVLTAVAPTLAALTACLLTWANRIKTQEIATSVDKVHTAVNSERTLMLEELKKAKEELLNISTKFATLQEMDRERPRPRGRRP